MLTNKNARLNTKLQQSYIHPQGIQILTYIAATNSLESIVIEM